MCIKFEVTWPHRLQDFNVQGFKKRYMYKMSTFELDNKRAWTFLEPHTWSPLYPNLDLIEKMCSKMFDDSPKNRWKKLQVERSRVQFKMQN